MSERIFTGESSDAYDGNCIPVESRLQRLTERYIYSQLAYPLFRRTSGVNPLIIYYHVVRDERLAHISDLYMFRSVSQFKRDMEVLLRHFRVLTLKELLMCRKERRPPPANSFMLTFDDGLSECYSTIAPILSQYGVPATFFLCSAFVDNRDMAYDLKKSLLACVLRTRLMASAEERQVRLILGEAGLGQGSASTGVLGVEYSHRHFLDEIAAVLALDFSAYLKSNAPYLTSEQVVGLLNMGHSVGAHSIDHPRYSDIPFAEQVRQTRESIRFVRERFSVDYGVFSFPHSDAGVSKEFFQETFKRGLVDLSFGNQGLLDDSVDGNIQRTSMEKTFMSAEGILGRSYARRFAKILSGRRIVKRK